MESSELSLIETTAPLSPELLKGYIATMTEDVNRTPRFIIDYNNSLIKEEFLLNYIGNLRMCVLIKEDISLEAKKALIKAYLVSRIPQAANNITHEVAALLLKMQDVALPDGFLKVSERAEVIEENKHILEEWASLLASIPYMVPFCFNYYAETIGKKLLESGEIKTIDNPLLVSPNVINLLYIPHYIELYLSRAKSFLPRMYKYLFYNACFERKGLIAVIQEKTSLAAFMYSLEKNVTKPNTHNALQL